MAATTTKSSRFFYLGVKEIRDRHHSLATAAARPAELMTAVDRAEQLLLEIRPDRRYELDYVQHRLLGKRPRGASGGEVRGDHLAHDLRLLIHELTDRARIDADTAGHRVFTIRELAQELNVSTKTITRWRRFGLVSRRYLFGDQKRLGYCSETVERFVAAHGELVSRGSRFSHLSVEEREAIYDAAREITATGVPPMQVIRAVARRVGRSVETIRYTLKHHDQTSPEKAIFPDHHGPVRAETKRRIHERYRRGESIESLARQFCRTKTSIARIVAEVRMERIAQLPLDFVAVDEFLGVEPRSEKEREILAELPTTDDPPRKVRLPAGLPSYLAALYDVPLLSREQEAHLFRKLNYLKYKASMLRERLDARRPRNDVMDRIESIYEHTVAVKNQIIRANLRLVISIARRYLNASQSFFDLVSDGNMSLIRAVEKFDYSRGNKFSTYASWAIMKNFARSIPQEHRQHEQFRTSQEELLPVVADVRSDEYEQERDQSRREAQVERLLGRLDIREKMIISYRYGLDRNEEPLTLKQVGEAMGVTKERIRQIETRALDKLREAALEENLAFPI